MEKKAIAALNGQEIGGRTLNINEARPKTNARSGGGGGGRDRGGYGGGRGGTAAVEVVWRTRGGGEAEAGRDPGNFFSQNGPARCWAVVRNVN